jgi:hypothetical protein
LEPVQSGPLHRAAWVRKVLGWPRRCKLARAFLWGYNDKKAEVGPTSGPPWRLSHSGETSARLTVPRPHKKRGAGGAYTGASECLESTKHEGLAGWSHTCAVGRLVSDDVLHLLRGELAGLGGDQVRERLRPAWIYEGALPFVADIRCTYRDSTYKP